MSFSVDIVGKEALKFEAVVEVLKVVEKKDNLFANFPIGATIQDRLRFGVSSEEEPDWYDDINILVFL